MQVQSAYCLHRLLWSQCGNSRSYLLRHHLFLSFNVGKTHSFTALSRYTYHIFLLYILIVDRTPHTHTQMSDFADAAAQPISSSPRPEMRTLIDMHKKRGVLPTLQRNGNTATHVRTASGGGGIEVLPEASPAANNAVAPELSALFGNMQAKKKASLQVYERNGSPTIGGGGAMTSGRTANLVNASSNSSINQASSSSTSSQQVCAKHIFGCMGV